jgi:hypothetical protein
MLGGSMGLRRSALSCFAATVVALAASAAPARAEFGFVTSWSLGLDHRAGGLAVDSADDVYVADSSGAEIQKFTSDGTLVTRWGSFGNGNGQFNDATDVALGSGDRVYVADQDNDRIQVFTPEGAFIGRWGSSGSDDGQFRDPVGIATDPAGNVYVADRGNHRIQKFDSDGDFVTEWGSEGTDSGRFCGLSDVATDSAGDVYVTDGDVYQGGVCGEPRIQRFTADGTLVTAWGSQGRAPGQFHPGATLTLATSPDGNVWVAEWFAVFTALDVEVPPPVARLQQFTPSGRFIREFGCIGNGNQNFWFLHGVATDAAGNVYVGGQDGRTADHPGQIQKLGDPGTPADCSLVLDARAKRRQTLKKRHVIASCPDEACGVSVTGRAQVEVKGNVKGARLRLKNRSLAAGEEEKIRLQFTDRRHRLKIRRAMQKNGSKKAKMFVHLQARDAHGIGAEKDVSFRLKG